jgi:ATP-dependent DNA ligase
MGIILDKGGEGLVVRDPEQRWIPKRSRGLLKYKPFSDDEGTITGFVSGRKTEKGSKLLGLIGALILDYKGKRLELSGLTNEEREFSCAHYTRYATSHPGEDMLADAQGRFFKVGDKVTFKYRELSDDGLPKEARYWRKRSE